MTYPHLIVASVLALTAVTAQAQAPATASQPEPVATAPTPASPAVQPPRQAGFVKTLKGNVQVQGPEANAVARPAQAGDLLLPGGRITTGPDSAASVVLRDGTTLVVGPSSQLDLKAFSFDATTHDGNLLASLLKGSLRMITGLLGKSHPEAVRVETQFAFVGVRGTDFIVQADEQP
ncbi:FecR family protein [Polaromonas sp. YR568]|uniref:FecR family protein n=1 Tax=Polaromonas sp. YR568 TaxID=1855301 RepID=UPI0008E19A55|nr:FecR family protein [Polaromonas sp. YR568]SFU92373.1 FecR family protein [Polaromonas sp. YR568]